MYQNGIDCAQQTQQWDTGVTLVSATENIEKTGVNSAKRWRAPRNMGFVSIGFVDVKFNIKEG
ncbi:hypothetical protein V6x_48330 [Gimesia chilikensis]|uniref:Uncharacterized protein n=1 Tax=Gimesia chilikensis TaxID=2605989 RepID=A0A517WIM7_9PLAN|nr:hypothetical protein V6x_48330 [Gimesia chilikensis]